MDPIQRKLLILKKLFFDFLVFLDFEQIWLAVLFKLAFHLSENVSRRKLLEKIASLGDLFGRFLIDFGPNFFGLCSQECLLSVQRNFSSEKLITGLTVFLNSC